jgi:hypothetical protein
MKAGRGVRNDINLSETAVEDRGNQRVPNAVFRKTTEVSVAQFHTSTLPEGSYPDDAKTKTAQS